MKTIFTTLCFTLAVAFLAPTANAQYNDNGYGAIINRDGTFAYGTSFWCESCGRYFPTRHNHNQGGGLNVNINSNNNRVETRNQSSGSQTVDIDALIRASSNSAELRQEIQDLKNELRRDRMARRDADTEDRLPHAANTARQERAQERARVRAEIRAAQRQESEHDHDTDWVTITNNVMRTTIKVSATLDNRASIHYIEPGEELEIEMDCADFRSNDWSVTANGVPLRAEPQKYRDSKHHFTYETPREIQMDWAKTSPELKKLYKSTAKEKK